MNTPQHQMKSDEKNRRVHQNSLRFYCFQRMKVKIFGLNVQKSKDTVLSSEKSLKANENYARLIHRVQTASYSTANPQKQIPDQEYSKHAHCNCTRSGILLTHLVIVYLIRYIVDIIHDQKHTQS